MDTLPTRATVNGQPANGLSEIAKVLLCYLAPCGSLMDWMAFEITVDGQPVDFDLFAYRVHGDINSPVTSPFRDTVCTWVPGTPFVRQS